MTSRISGRIIALLSLSMLSTTNAQTPKETNVDCGKGHTINGALAKLDRREPNLVVVSGTCTETVEVQDFNDLTIAGLPGAVLIPGAEAVEAVFVNVAIRFRFIGFTINGTGASVGIALFRCVNCVISNNTINGVSSGVSAISASSIDVTNNRIFVTGAVPGESSLGVSIAQVSKAILTRNLIEHTGAPDSGTGLSVSGNAYARVGRGSTFRGFGSGIAAGGGGAIDVFGTLNLTDPDFPVFENNQSAGARSEGGTLAFHGRSSLTGNGSLSPHSLYTGGIVVDNGGHLTLGNLVEIKDNLTQGVLLISNSTGLFNGGVKITNNRRNGLVVVTSSAVELRNGFGLNDISGNTLQDVLCDSSSVITGASAITGATKTTCPNLKLSKSDPIP